jgi:hypothetical protein
MLSPKLDNTINIVYFLRVAGKSYCRIQNDREDNLNHIIPFCVGALPLRQVIELLAVSSCRCLFFGYDYRKMRLRTTGGNNALRKCRAFNGKIGRQTWAGGSLYKELLIYLLRA